MYSHHSLLENPLPDHLVTAQVLKERYVWAQQILGVRNVKEFDDLVFECMVADGWVNLEKDIPINNTVCNGHFVLENGRRPNINLMALAIPLLPFAIDVNTSAFPAVTFPLTGAIQARLVLFATSKMVITGFICPSEMLYAIEFVRALLQRCGYKGVRYNPDDLPVENVVSRLQVPAVIKKKKFLKINPAAQQSSVFPGLFVHFVRSNPDGSDRNFTVLVFDGDFCVFVGWRTKQELRAMYYLVSPYLYMATSLKREGEKEKHPLYAYVKAEKAANSVT